MKMDQQKIDEHTKELLQKSILKPASPDFDDRLMQKILLSPTTPQLNGNVSRRAWIFLIFTIVSFLFSAQIAGQYSAGYFDEINEILRITVNFVFYGGLSLFIPLVLYHFDALVQTSFLKKMSKIANT